MQLTNIHSGSVSDTQDQILPQTMLLRRKKGSRGQPDEAEKQSFAMEFKHIGAYIFITPSSPVMKYNTWNRAGETEGERASLICK